ncbi:hypothetical protein CC80DRAFT_489011 [Byssothecium circinans]|uniref:Extracellular mutant protein 11 C-terminal domain-containing protein n=1 Tax=Byssothecium circinans TaxID=147558 RepID=A0A6A5U9W6_9PLEO|nr:hypothetical protein CC80DRAFT_489011 [Byssothecium circinans]
MNQFIAGGGRASPVPNQPSRAQRAANAKVQVSGTAFTHSRPTSQHDTTRRPSGGNAHQPNTQQPLQQIPQQRLESLGQNGRRDTYDTDAESIDTTTHRGSVIQVEDSQPPQQPHAQEHYRDEGGDGGSEYTDEFVDDEEDWQEMRPQQQFPQVHYQDSRGAGPFFAEGNSYPSTTSGPGEDFFNNLNAGQEPQSDDDVHPNDVSPSPRQPTARPQFAVPSATAPSHPQPFPSVPKQIAPLPMPKPSAFMQKGYEIRQQVRSNASQPVHGFHGFQNPVTQQHREAPQQISHDFRPKAQVQASNLPQRSARGFTGPNPSQRVVNTVEPTVPTTRQAPVPAKQEPVERRQNVEEDPLEEEKHPIEDYDQPALFHMSYDTLKNESFDQVPRKLPQVLPSDVLSQPIEERLEHAWKNLDPQNQSMFFRSMSTDEWEEAGDWFLERFTDIIKRTRYRRHEKRKLAREFEGDIEKRYRHVEKRQQHVQNALDGMKKQGQFLLPQRTPRSSNEPRGA